MKLGLSTFAFSWQIGIYPHLPSRPFTVFDFLQSAASSNVSLVQIADNLPLHELHATELQEVRKQAKELGIDIEVGTRGLVDDSIERYIEIASYLSSPILRMVVDAKDYSPTKKEIIAVLKRWEPTFREKNIVLVIENHDRFPSLTLKEIIKSIGSPYIKICLDTVNSFGSLEGTREVINTLAPFTKNIHIKDFKISRPYHNLGFILEGTPAGHGMLDIDYLLHHKNIKRDPDITACIELWVSPESTIEKTIEKETNWRNISINNMKMLIEQ